MKKQAKLRKPAINKKGCGGKLDDSYLNHHGSVFPPFSKREERLRDQPWLTCGFIG